MTIPAGDARPLVLHLVHRFDVGGLENGIVNLINHMPANRYRHAVVALTEVTDFRRRIHRDDVVFRSLHKPPGQGLWLYPQLFALFREMRPAVLHTRNLGTLEAVVPAWLARIPVRIHGEHGRDIDDLDGSSRAHRWLRRLYRPFVHRYVAVSEDLAEYLIRDVGIAAERVTRIGNGVDAARFSPAVGGRQPIPGCPFGDADHWLVGTVGRMQAVKDQTLLVRAFVRAIECLPALRDRLRLVIVGDGPLRAQCRRIVDLAGCADLVWLPGAREDVPDVMRGLDCFVLPSLAEGISNTILEAMATGLPVIATDVGGSGRLIEHGISGEIVPSGDCDRMASALSRLAESPTLARSMGSAGRSAVERQFSLAGMVRNYLAEYDRKPPLRIPARQATG